MKLPKKLVAIASPVRRALRSQFHTLWYRARQRQGLRVFALGQRLRRFADHVTHTAGTTNGERVRRWFQDKKAGWYAVLAFEGTGYVLQSDVDAFVEACQCRNQRKAYEPKLVNTVAS